MSRYRYRFNSKRRDALWCGEAWKAHSQGRGPLPICNLCGEPVNPHDHDPARRAWDESHIGAPKALGGRVTGVAHRTCNHKHGAEVVTPMVAWAKRQAARHAGDRGPGRGRYPMQAGRFSTVSKTFRNGLQPRLTLGERMARTRALLAIAPAPGEQPGEQP